MSPQTPKGYFTIGCMGLLSDIVHYLNAEPFKVESLETAQLEKLIEPLPR